MNLKTSAGHEPPDFGEVLLYMFLLGLAVVLATIGMSACSPTRNAQTAETHVLKTQVKYPDILARYCARSYPPQVTTNTTTEYVHGDSLVFNDTLTIYDTLTRTLNKTITRTVKQIDTVYRLRTTQVTSTAAIDSMQRYVRAKENEITTSLAAVAKQKQIKIILCWAAGILFCYTVARWLLKAYTRITLP